MRYDLNHNLQKHMLLVVLRQMYDANAKYSMTTGEGSLEHMYARAAYADAVLELLPLVVPRQFAESLAPAGKGFSVPWRQVEEDAYSFILERASKSPNPFDDTGARWFPDRRYTQTQEQEQTETQTQAQTEGHYNE